MGGAGKKPGQKEDISSSSSFHPGGTSTRSPTTRGVRGSHYPADGRAYYVWPAGRVARMIQEQRRHH